MDVDPECMWAYSITIHTESGRRIVNGTSKQGRCRTRTQLIDHIVGSFGDRVRAIEVHSLEKDAL